MALLDYISIEISEVLSDCGYMNDRVFGKYMRFLFYWYRDGCKPLTDSALIRLSNSRGSDLDDIKARLFETPDGWVQKRLFKTYQDVLKKSEKAQASANARWEQEKRNSDAMRSHSDRKGERIIENNADAMLIVNSKGLRDSLSLTGEESKSVELKLPDPVDVAFKQFQEFAKKHGLASPTKLTKRRRAQLKARFVDDGPGVWAAALREIEQSRFLRGENVRGWQLDFDFLIKAENFQKVIEGKYHDRHRKPKQDGPGDDEFRGVAIGALQRSRERE